MYNAYFRLNESPFSIAPDPRFLFMSARHREALAHLMYGVSGEGGFVVLTGEVGTGKTTICRCLLEQVPDDCDVAFIVNPGLSAVEMLAAICDELRIGYPENLNIKGYVDRFNSYLLKGNAAGRKTVLIIDEAQLLDPKVLAIAMFVAIPAAGAFLIVWLIQRWERWWWTDWKRTTVATLPGLPSIVAFPIWIVAAVVMVIWVAVLRFEGLRTLHETRPVRVLAVSVFGLLTALGTFSLGNDIREIL